MTTDSDHPFFKYSNLVRGIIMTRINQIWVIEITYIRVAHDFAYLSLVTNAYSRKIVGHCLHNTLGAAGPLNALQMAVDEAGISPG